MGFGGDASFRQPMAIGVIGGLITSTALSLLLVPVVFTFVSAAEQKILGRGLAAQDRAVSPSSPT